MDLSVGIFMRQSNPLHPPYSGIVGILEGLGAVLLEQITPGGGGGASISRLCLVVFLRVGFCTAILFWVGMRQVCLNSGGLDISFYLGWGLDW